MNPNLIIDVPIRISQSADDLRVRAATEDYEYLPLVPKFTVRGTDALVGELNETNKNSPHEFLYRRYPPIGSDDDSDRVPPPRPEDDPAKLGVHFATINHDQAALTDWLTDRFKCAGSPGS